MKFPVNPAAGLDWEAKRATEISSATRFQTQIPARLDRLPGNPPCWEIAEIE
jgi:hypothetical protein